MLMSTVASAQSSIKVQAPNLVAVDEQFNLTFIIEGEHSPSDFQWAASDDFQLVWGPQRGSSSSIQIINGKTTKSSQTSYTYILLPKKTGTFQLPQATATVKGDKISSSSVSIEVVSNGAGSRQPGASQGAAQDRRNEEMASTGTVPNDDLFLKFSIGKSKVVVGETVSASLKLYQRVNVGGFEDAKFPTFNGFWSQETYAPTNIEFQRESIGDKIYNTAVLRTWSLIPQQAGDLQIEPAELVCLVNVRNRAASTGSIFDSFFQDDYRTIRKRVVSSAYTVHVSPLPAGAPASFGGGVGTFKMNAELSRDSLLTHDAATLKVTVSGKGNVSLLEAPKINFPPDFETYDSKSTDGQGSKTFEYTFIPRSHGTFDIGPVEYSYYDIQSGKYVTLSSGPLTVKVGKGNESAEAQQTGGQLVSSVNRKDVKDLGSDVRFISTRMPSFTDKGHGLLVYSGLFWCLLAVLCAAAAGAWFAFRKMAARRADVVGSRNRGATKMARKRLSQAGEYLAKNLYTAFYEELHRAMLGYVSDKLNMDASDMSKDNISAQLVASGAPEALTSEFVALLDACEFARYSPDAGHEAMNTHYETAVNVISSIDGSIGRKKGPSVAAMVMAILLMLPLSAKAAHTSAPDSLWNAGTAAYADGRWGDAVQSWGAISELGVEAPELYYNMGNAYFKSGDNARAILYYEKALKMDPSYSDARFNLEFVNSFIQDRIETVPEFFLKTWLRKMSWTLSADAWTILFFVLLALTLSCVLAFLLAPRAGMRKAGFFTAIVLAILALSSLSMATWQRSDGMKMDKAIVVKPVSSVKSAPGSGNSTDLFILHEGTKVRINDEVGEWANIELSDGRQGWLKKVDLEII